MIRLTSNDVRCALFASVLQQSDQPSQDAVLAAISAAIDNLGLGGCLTLMAQEFGDHPETACERMRWIGQLDLPVVG
jgi:hypothetical protein